MAAPTSKLILIDGFAGSGKSTAAQHLWLNLVRGEREAIWFHEHETGHPIFQYGEVEELLQVRPGEFEQRVLAGWESFVDAADGGVVRILEGSFFQIPAGVMMAMNVPASRIRAMLRRIDAALAGHGASLIYLCNRNLREALVRIGDVRGVRWLEAMIDVLGQSPYGQRHRVRNLDGLIEYYRRQQAVSDSVFPRLTVRRLAIDVSRGQWDQYERQMAKFLAVSPVPAAPLATRDLLRHVGTFRGTTSGRTCVITTDARTLYMQLPATNVLPLVRATGANFCLQSLPVDIRFDYDKSGRARRFSYASRMVNEVLADTSWIRTQ